MNELIENSEDLVYLDELRKMIDLLLSGKYIDAADVLQEVFEEHLKNFTAYYDVRKERTAFFRSTFSHAIEHAIEDDVEAAAAYQKCRDQLQDYQSLSLEEMHQIYHRIAEIAELAEAHSKKQGTRQLAKEIMTCIDRHFTEPDCDTCRLSEIMGISTSYLHRVFKEHYGKTPLAYITECRIRMARDLLKSTNYKISEISELVGYGTEVSFIRAFRKTCGLSPREYLGTENLSPRWGK